MIPLHLNPKPLEVAVLPHLLFQVPMKQQFCRLLFVFEAGSGFSQSSSWEHDSIRYIKARIQLKLYIREQSRELATPHYCEEDAIEPGQFLQQPPLAVATNAKQPLLMPLQTRELGAFPAGRSLAYPRETGI